VCSFLLLLCAAAPVDLKVEDAAALALMGADAYQTVSFPPWRQERESDCIIGHHPSEASVVEYFAGAAVAHELAVSFAYRWHPWAARLIEAVTIGWEGETVAVNAGVRIGF